MFTWADPWIGIPYLKRGRDLDGLDCLGLFLLLSKERMGCEPPDPYCTIHAAIRGGVAAQNAYLYREVSEPQEGDAILLRHKGFPIHVGYCIDKQWMLHADPELGVVAERWNGSKWKNRVIGVFRYDR